MNTWIQSKSMAAIASAVLVLPILAGCGSGSSGSASLPPVDDTMRAPAMNPNKPMAHKPGGMSGQTKLVMLAGAAALYYMYKKNNEKRAQGDKTVPQYYLSKNGRVYYRDAQNRAHWVTPPKAGLQVPAAEAAQYRDFQGYAGSASGRSLVGLPEGM